MARPGKASRIGKQCWDLPDVDEQLVKMSVNDSFDRQQSIIDLVSCSFSQSSKLYGVREATEHSLYAFLSRFDAIGLKQTGVQKPFRAVMLWPNAL